MDVDPPRRRLRWGISLLFALLLGVGFVAGRVCTESGTYAMSLRSGIQALGVATRTGDPADYDTAIRHLSGAAALGFADHYPVFVLRAAEQMKAASRASHDPHHAFYVALASRDFALARKHAVGSAPKLRSYMERLIHAIESSDEGGV